MHLQADASLAEAPGFSTEQLESLSRSIEAKKQKLDADINAYIKKKQRELAQYEQELLAQYREMECGQTRYSATSPSPSVQATESTTVEPGRAEEKEKRTKHTRVHKRERELFGLTTIFLPLLETTSEVAPTKRKESTKKHSDEGMGERVMDLLSNTEEASPSRGADQQGKEHQIRGNKKPENMEHAEISYGDAIKDKRRAESVKKAKRPAMKKSSLRSSGEKSRRKRVSLVIDDQIVLPADQISEPPLTSPSDAGPSGTSSPSSSTASLDQAIDPRLMQPREDSPRHEHEDPVHHSIPLPSPFPGPSSSTNHTGHTLPDSPLTQSPQLTPQTNYFDLNYEIPSTTASTVMDPSPPEPESSHYMPQHASSHPIYASLPERNLESEEDFSSYVGGISGSGVDDFDQTGSLGFPSSLGASYMESYMQSRPLSVRMAAAEKAGGEEEKARVAKDRAEREKKRVEEAKRRQDMEDDDMDVIGSMEGF